MGKLWPDEEVHLRSRNTRSKIHTFLHLSNLLFTCTSFKLSIHIHISFYHSYTHAVNSYTHKHKPKQYTYTSFSNEIFFSTYTCVYIDFSTLILCRLDHGGHSPMTHCCENSRALPKGMLDLSSRWKFYFVRNALRWWIKTMTMQHV